MPRAPAGRVTAEWPGSTRKWKVARVYEEGQPVLDAARKPTALKVTKIGEGSVRFHCEGYDLSRELAGPE